MADLKLPDDLAAFLKAGKQLEYDPASCEAGLVTLLLPERLKVELFPTDCQSTDIEHKDPHEGELGCYLVPAVSLLANCTGGYDAVGLLLWFPEEGRYGTWDSSHTYLAVLPRETTWGQTAQKPAQHINSQWVGAFEDSAPAEALVPWPKYPYSPKQIYEPVPAP
jgi:hypothetical protein